MTRESTHPRPWRVVTDGQPVPFATETAARLRAALSRARGAAVAVEHRDADGWHDCPSPGERIPASPSGSHRDARQAGEAHRATLRANRRPGLPF